MKIYPPEEGFTKREMQQGTWSLYVDVKCTNTECGKEYAASSVGGIDGKCPRCGARCA